MNLKQWQEKFGVKRIDFSKIKPSGKAEQAGNDELICPYCEAVIEYESEETGDIIKGTSYQCPYCEKWFYASADITVNTYSTPMEDAVLQSRRYIEGTYKHVDSCEALGHDWEDKQYGYVEWSVYAEYAKPLFENMEKEQDGEWRSTNNLPCNTEMPASGIAHKRLRKLREMPVLPRTRAD